jgi:hypothetical protein
MNRSHEVATLVRGSVMAILALASALDLRDGDPVDRRSCRCPSPQARAAVATWVKGFHQWP